MIRDLTALKAFAAIAALGSFARAAEKLKISRPMASKHVADLEADLGVKLFNRTTRQISLTEAGQKLVTTATTLLELIDTTEQDIRGATKSPRGTLRINAPMSFGVLHLGRIINDFVTQCPDVEVELNLDDRLVNVVEEGYDIAIRIRRLEDSSLVARYLAPARMVTCASPAYLAEKGEPEHPRDLEAHNCLVYDYLARMGTWSFERDGEVVNVRAKGRLRGNNGEVLMQAAVDGLGITLAPTFIASEALRSGALKPVLCNWYVVEPAFFAVMPPGRVNVGKVRAFLDHLAKALGKEPFWDRNLPIKPRNRVTQ